jgi:hypothetical protein
MIDDLSMIANEIYHLEQINTELVDCEVMELEVLSVAGVLHTQSPKIRLLMTQSHCGASA